MYSVTRNRETIYAEYIFNYHPDFKDNIEKWYDRYLPYHIEGGDVLNLNDHILAVGISQRTEAGAIDQLAKNCFKPVLDESSNSLSSIFFKIFAVFSADAPNSFKA